MPRPLRILAYLHSFEPGGVERVALRLCSAWQKDGAQVKVLLGRNEGAMGEDAPPLDYLLYSSGRFSTAPVETLWMTFCLWRLLKVERPDILFCAGNSYTIVAVLLRLLPGRRLPPIVAKVSNSFDRRDMIAPVRLGYLLWLRLQGLLIGHWVGIAEPMRAEIEAALRLPAERIAIVEDPAMDAADLRRLAEKRDETARQPGTGQLFVSAGRLAPQKRFDLLIRAFAKGAGVGDRLVILGDGPQRRRLQALVDRLGLCGRVTLPGHSRDLDGWLARCDAFLLASDFEGVPAVILEAMAAGVPIIATESSVSMRGLLGSGRFGRLVRRGDEAELAQAIAATETMQVDCEGARRHAERFTVERAAPAYLRLMRAAVAKGVENEKSPFRRCGSQ